MDAIIFIYKKGTKIKVLNKTQALKGHELILDGWKHTHTIDSAVFLQYLLDNEDVDIVSEILELKM